MAGSQMPRANAHGKHIGRDSENKEEGVSG